MEREFHARPSDALAEKLHEAIVRLETAKVSFPRIDAGCHAGMSAANRSLEAVAMRVLDAALSSLDGEAGKTRAALVKTASVFSDDGEIGIFDSRLAITRANLEGERTEARRDPLNWLAVRGF